eukprot:6188628-Pleurochrysis_carterae.AAC.5
MCIIRVQQLWLSSSMLRIPTKQQVHRQPCEGRAQVAKAETTPRPLPMTAREECRAEASRFAFAFLSRHAPIRSSTSRVELQRKDTPHLALPPAAGPTDFAKSTGHRAASASAHKKRPKPGDLSARRPSLRPPGCIC